MEAKREKTKKVQMTILVTELERNMILKSSDITGLCYTSFVRSSALQKAREVLGSEFNLNKEVLAA